MDLITHGVGKAHSWPGCVGVDEAARIFGWPTYFITLLMRSGHLKPLGKPAQNARKWFASVELERLSRDPAWLDKAVRLVERYVQDVNRKRRSKLELEATASGTSPEVEAATIAALRRGTPVAAGNERN